MKLPLFKRYQIVTTLENYNNNLEFIKTISTFNTKVINNNVKFYTNNKIDIDGFNCIKHTQNIVKKIFLVNILLVGIVVLIILFMKVSPYYIKEIKYKTGSIKDDIVYDILIEYVNDQKYPNLNKISKELMILFPHYSWIEIKKSGRVLYLYIELNQIIDIKKDSNIKYGDFVSGYDAYIKSIVVTQGKPLIAINQTVKKGDILISGNIKDQNVPPNGIVIGEIIFTKEIVVKKTNIIRSYSGSLLNYRYLNIGKKSFKKKKNNYLKFKVDQNVELNIFNFIKIIDETIYELDDYEIQHTNDTAVNYAKSLIYYELEKYKTSDDEKILNIDLIEIVEKDDTFIIKLLVKADKNIVVLKQY